MLLTLTDHTIAGIADTGEKVVNAITDVFHVKHVPPPNPVIKEWPFGNQGNASWE